MAGFRRGSSFVDHLRRVESRSVAGALPHHQTFGARIVPRLLTRGEIPR